MNKNISVRGITEGALMAGMTVILMLLGNLPVIGSIIYLFCSIPITIVTIRQGSLAGGLAAVLSSVITGLFMGPLFALSCGLQYALLGWVIGLMIHKHKSAGKTLSACMVVSVFSAIVLLLVSLALMGFSMEAVQESMNQASADMIALYESTGIMDTLMQQSGLTKAQFLDMMQQVAKVSMRILPAVLIVGQCVMSAITCFLTMQVLKRLKIRIPRMHGFSHFILPINSVWGLITVWAIWLASDYFDAAGSLFTTAALNCLIIFAVALFIDGLAVLTYWFSMMKVSVFTKVFTGILAVIFFTGFVTAAVILGLADLLFDFRRLRVDNKKVR